jgi:hypothetical protein
LLQADDELSIAPKARDREADPNGPLFVFGINRIRKKQGAAGITTAAPYIAGQWGRGG